MSTQHDSEGKLFEDSAAPTQVPGEGDSTKKREKRRSVPVNPTGDAAGSPRQGASGSGGPGGGGQGSPRGRPSGGDAGTVLGFPGSTWKEDQPGVMVIRTDNGVVEMNVLTDVFKDGLSADHLEKFLNYIQATHLETYMDFIEGILYQGFDREFYIHESLKKVSIKVFSQFAILGAVRGSNFSKIVDSCLFMPDELKRLVAEGKIVKKAKKRDEMTILRFTASIPHWVAYWLFQKGIAKKIENLDCPAHLQFPGAASLPMSKRVRLQHIEFCIAFSSLLPGGSFNPNIYRTAFNNQLKLSVVPSMLKDTLGVGAVAEQGMEATELAEHLGKQVARVR